MIGIAKSLFSIARRRMADLMDRLERTPAGPTDFECMRECADAVSVARPQHRDDFAAHRTASNRSRAA